MKKIMIPLVAFLLMLAMPIRAQIFVLEEDSYNPRQGTDPYDVTLIVPQQSVDWDQNAYVPLGSGVAALIGFGAAYALTKRRKKED